MKRNINRIIGIFLFLAVFMPDRNLQSADEPGDGYLSDSDKKKIIEKLYNAYREELPLVKDIKPAEVTRLFNQQKVVFVDVRTSAEMEISMLPEAVTVEEYFKKKDIYKELIVVAYCTIGYRSGKFAEKMGAEGDDVRNLAGGMLAWVFEGGRVYHDNKEIKRIHVYGPNWDYPPQGYESLYFSWYERLF
jgi:sodium/bile acid cotransporter 7